MVLWLGKDNVYRKKPKLSIPAAAVAGGGAGAIGFWGQWHPITSFSLSANADDRQPPTTGHWPPAAERANQLQCEWCQSLERLAAQECLAKSRQAAPIVTFTGQ